MPPPGNDEFRRTLVERADQQARRERAAEAELEEMRTAIERLRRERETKLAEFHALTHPGEVPAATAAGAVVDEPPPAPASAVEPVVAAGPEPSADADERVAHQADAADWSPPLQPLPPADTPPADDVLGALEAYPSEDVAASPDLEALPLAPADGPISNQPPAEPRTARSVSPIILVAALAGLSLAGLALAGYAYWSATRTEAPSPVSAPVVPLPGGASQAPVQRPAAAPTPVAPVAAAPAASPAGDSLRVELLVSRAAWIRAVVDGQIAVNRTVPAGERLVLSARTSVEFRTGDAGAVGITVNGKDQGLAGRSGQVLSKRIDANAAVPPH